ncbi:hypothetical protein E5161_06900 [Cohnella pontilimi]|uniref:Lipoprotein n=1 Tax=Cohnella pontilimi TaxID=2564100 RepID=A0A4U0FCX1_9BACL|nr:hypothetical protein [Cohnella pontilimi]TJY42577.1 hypothetical protein E5161_06900 [Cohnella pontilimi]
MKIKMLSALIALIALCGCSRMPTNPIKGNAVIDWVDFIKLNGNSYYASWEMVIQNPNLVTHEVVGEVKFKVADVVTNPGYITKDGDAAFLEIGTKLYRVEGYEVNEMIAAKDETRIGGYRLFLEDGFAPKVRRSYKDVPKDKVEKIELYQLEETTPYKTLAGGDKERFIQLLDSGKDTPNYTPQNRERDPTYYHMVFYTGEPIANAFTIADDGTNVFFSPWDTRIVDPQIRMLLQP